MKLKLFQDKINRFLWLGLALLVLLSSSVLYFLSSRMSKEGSTTITEVGSLYMSSMSEQIALHFETTMALHLEELEALVGLAGPIGIHEDPEARKDLISHAQALDFQYMGFYNLDGSFEMLYGSMLAVVDPEPFMNSLLAGNKKVAAGVNAEGQRVILMGIPSSHEPTAEHPCAGLVGALPVSYIGETLSLEENEDHIYSYIIRRNGSFVIRSSDEFRHSYFERALDMYEDISGLTPEEYLDELSTAMEQNEEYSNILTMAGERQHLYCTQLAYSEWYLLTFMPYSTVDDIITSLGTQWGRTAVIGGSIIFVALMLLFILYFRLNQEQIVALDKARQEAEAATKSKSEFLSNMSHDIRTPMNAIVGVTAIATANIDDKEQVRNCLKKITLSSKHLLGLINDVLDMSKIESGKMTLSMEMISLREVVDSIVTIVQPQIHTKNQQFNVSIHDISSENVYCDSVRLNQVLLNLLSNATKYTPDGGSIFMTLSEEASSKGENYARVHIRVKDTGIGMTPEFQKTIFDAFTREDSTRVHKTEGTGLGMAITKYIVDAMGGTIELSSELGKGSEFHVTLDLEKAAAAESDMVLPSWNMLVVDDDQQLCESAVNSLRDIGINAEWTLDGEGAVSMAEKRHDTGDDYQIVLLDWKLPGIDGFETARRIRKLLGDDVPIMLISAYDWSEIEDEAKGAGITGFISKPLFKSTLYYGLKQFAEDGSAAPAPEKADGFAHLEGRKILLAEDNDLNWEIANELLSSELKVELDWAENGHICLDKFQAAPTGHYDAILMDLRMPVMTGIEATEAIRALDRDDAKTIPIIAMTADAFAEDVKKCLDAGMNAHVAKPIDVREVGRLLAKFIQN